MKKNILITFAILSQIPLFAQSDSFTHAQTDTQLVQRVLELENKIEKLKNLNISGYTQTQLQFGEENAYLHVGAPNATQSKAYNRIGIRRGRLKFNYTKGIGSGVFQLDITEKGIALKDAYIKITAPWISTISATFGAFNRPFGHEISYSSAYRESPERSRVFQTLFPGERDIGAKLTIQAPKTSLWSMFKIDAGLFAGNGIKLETDNRQDFISHLEFAYLKRKQIQFVTGVSYYNGSVYKGSKNIYQSYNNEFILDSNKTNLGKYAQREYIGLDARIYFLTQWGFTKITSEYLFGTQPGSKSNSNSPNSSVLSINDLYIRNFNGGYVMLVHDIEQIPFSFIVKYDWYNPNIKVKGNDIGNNYTHIGDIAYTALGFGVQWKISDSLKLLAYHELVRNETSMNLIGYERDQDDDVFTLRLQYKFH